MDKSHCLACDSLLNIIYYQRRAADEPPDKVVYCNKCPLDTGRLSLSPLSGTATNLLSKQKKPVTLKHLRPQTVQNIVKVHTKSFLIVRGRAASKCYSIVNEQKISLTNVLAIPIYITTSTKPVMSYYHINSVTQGKAYIDISSNTVAPFITHKLMDVYMYKDTEATQEGLKQQLVIGHEYALPGNSDGSTTVLRTLHNGQKPYIMIELLDNKDTTVLNALRATLADYGTETSIKSIISTNLLNTLFIQSGKAYDWPSAPDNGYTYAWKPDGERFWYVKYECMWLFCRRLLSGQIIGWNICSSVQQFGGIGPVVDVELMIGHDPIFIDLLIDSNSQPMPVSRNLNLVIDQYNSIKDEGIVDVPIHVRDYYRSDKELLLNKHKLKYPVDGIVGIQDGSMTIIKLKDKKSIELELTETGDLVTSDKHVVATSTLHFVEEVGSIIEIRFEKQSRSDEFVITEVFTRTDKTKANDMQACINIMNSISDTPDSLARRNVVQWCNGIKSKINQVASKMSGKGRVILDIGAGDGQAVSNYSTDPEITYLLLEPDQRKCRSMYRRLQDLDKNNARIFYQSSDVLNALRLLITKKVKYVVLCSSLKEILQQKDCIRTLKNCIRCCLACLSICYIVDELHDLAVEGLDIIGFGYMYDSADEKGILIDEHGVTMKRIDSESNQATVRWGADTVYSERAITLKDFNEIFTCKLARNLVVVITDSKDSLLNTVSSKLYYITNIKYGL